MNSQMIKVSNIRVPVKHRRRPCEEDIVLERSLKSEGLKDPIIVVRDGPKNKFVLADGGRRLKIYRKDNSEILAIIHEPGDENPDLLAGTLRIISNHHRKGFYPSQRAHYLKILINKYSVPMEELATACGVTKTTLKSWMLVADCGQEIRMMIDNGKLPVTASRLLSSLTLDGQAKIVEKFRDRVKVGVKELDSAIRYIHRSNPRLVRRPLSQVVRRSKRTASRVSSKHLKNMDIDEAHKKIADREREIGFMRREILAAKPIIEEMCKRASIRRALPSATLREFDVFIKEEGLHGKATQEEAAEAS